jgi:hypothetical protein
MRLNRSKAATEPARDFGAGLNESLYCSESKRLMWWARGDSNADLHHVKAKESLCTPSMNRQVIDSMVSRLSQKQAKPVCRPELSQIKPPNFESMLRDGRVPPFCKSLLPVKGREGDCLRIYLDGRCPNRLTDDQSQPRV